MKNIDKYILLALLAVVLISSRLLSPYPNFTAVGAIALFAGFYFGRAQGILILFGSLLMSDLLFEGVYDIKMMAMVYAGFAFSVWLGKTDINFGFKSGALNSILGIGTKAMLSGTVFYIISNLGVWLFSGMYALNLTGLIECYTMAIPFFKFTWLGDLSFSALIFGSYYAISAYKLKSVTKSILS